MKFKESIRFKYGNIRRGDVCLVNSLEAIYLGSYADAEWNHLFLVDNWDGGNRVIQIRNLDHVSHIAKKAPEIEGQMMLI